METKIQKFKALGKNEPLLQKYYQANQKEYIRKRFKAVKLLWEGKSQMSVAISIGCGYASLHRWTTALIENGMEEGLKELAKPRSFEKKQALDQSKKKTLKRIIVKKRPSDYGIDRQIWTAETIAAVIKKKWGIELKDSRIYEILDELGLSYQKAHRDYAEAETRSQKSFVKLLKKNLKESRTWGECPFLR